MVKALIKKILPYRVARAIVEQRCSRRFGHPPERKFFSSNGTPWKNHECSVYSQNGEDGILEFIFSIIGYETRIFVEFGFGAAENNSLRLVRDEAFQGLFMDAAVIQCEVFDKMAASFEIPNVSARNVFLTEENINGVIEANGFSGTIDLLSIDVDGNDYWMWKAIQVIQPRVVVVEYNASIGRNPSVSIPYKPDFDRNRYHPLGFYHGASLEALNRLATRKGYYLAGCESGGVNAFFIHRSLATAVLPSVAVNEAFRPHRNRLERGYTEAQQTEMIKDFDWQPIE